MKKVILSAVFAFATLSAFAQYQGDFNVGGSVGLGTSSSWTQRTIETTLNGTTSTNQSDKSKSYGGTNFGFQAEASYFVIDNLSLTAGVSYALNANGTDTKTFTNVAYGVIGAHYYVSLIDDRFYYTPGVQFGFGGGSYNTRTETYSLNTSTGEMENTTDKTSTPLGFMFTTDFHIGRIEFKPNQNWGVYADLITLSVTYNKVTGTTEFSENYRIKNIVEQTGVSFNLNYGFTIGVKYYL